MRESIHKYFRVGTLQWMSYPRRDWMQAVRAIAADDFFDVVEVAPCPDAQTRSAARALLEQSRMRACYGAHPAILKEGLNPNALDEVQRLHAEKRLLEMLGEARELGAEGIAFLAGKWAPESREQALDQLVKTTRALCDRAASMGMRVELEVFDYDVDKAVLIGPAPLAARFAAEVRALCPNFGLLVDLSHIPITHETPRFVLQTLRPYITHLHFGNAVLRAGCPAYGDKHPRLGYPNGENDVPELVDYLRALREEGFFRPEAPCILSMEVAPIGDEDEDMVMAGTKRALNRAWALLED